MKHVKKNDLLALEISGAHSSRVALREDVNENTGTSDNEQGLEEEDKDKEDGERKDGEDEEEENGEGMDNEDEENGKET
ncbi:hypothetical protein C0995_004134 [Termitomyces sp. Mi166|nr:hypothetical protein C0995_004134 [Termitomyces sp. Mi166\